MTWGKCRECVHFGALCPKKGGVFYYPDGKSKRVSKPSLPYCIKLNMGIGQHEYKECNYYKKNNMIVI
jgi:hypothetical protein